MKTYRNFVLGAQNLDMKWNSAQNVLIQMFTVQHKGPAHSQFNKKVQELDKNTSKHAGKKVKDVTKQQEKAGQIKEIENK